MLYISMSADLDCVIKMELHYGDQIHNKMLEEKEKNIKLISNAKT